MLIAKLGARQLQVVDALLIIVAFFLSFAIRFDYNELGRELTPVWSAVFLAVLLKLPVFALFGLYRRLWRYASIGEVQAILIGVSTGSLLLTIVVILVLNLPGVAWLDGFPRSVLIIDWLLTLGLVGGLRLGLRALGEGDVGPTTTPGGLRRILIVGAGRAGAMLASELRRNPHLGLSAIGFLDDDPNKQRHQIQDLPVLGRLNDLFATVKRHRIDEVLIAMPTAPGKVIRQVVNACSEASVAFKTIPGVYELAGGHVHVRQVREVRIEDLLRRESVKINIREIAEYLTTATVLVTGAGGSIGSELVRKIASFQPRHLILLGRGENSIYRIEQELARTHPHVKTTALIANIQDASKIDRLFAQYQPDVVFHAAAHKHVPLMELNPEEVVTNNIVGTRIIADTAHRHNVRRFVLISTDKTVNPTNVYGASKRIAEMIVRQLADTSATTFVTVRFGNVLASQGSVVPVFQEQILAGGPVLVAHPEATRYFMTIPEAAQLVIQAGAMGQGGEIFVLDMGDPVRIIDLAKDIIRLSGLELGRDIDIKITGLRPGDKLTEEVFAADEIPSKTSHDKIVVVHHPPVDGTRLATDIAHLADLALRLDGNGIRAKFRAMLPGYHEPGETLLPTPALPTLAD